MDGPIENTMGDVGVWNSQGLLVSGVNEIY